MARARLLKPGFFQNEHLAELPFAGRLLFAGLWTLADREGRLEDRPRRIKAALFPWDDVAIDDLLAGLAERGFITRYQAEDVAVIQIVKFHEHQKPHRNEQDSRLPQTKHDLGSADFGSRPAVTKTVTKTVIKTVESAEPATPASPPVLTYPCAGLPNAWDLTQAQLGRWIELYDVDVLAECKKALGWVHANMGRKKTATGMERFLTTWLAKATNERRDGVDRRQTERRTQSYAPSMHSDYDHWRDECRRDHNDDCSNFDMHRYRRAKEAAEQAEKAS